MLSFLYNILISVQLRAFTAWYKHVAVATLH